jgi:hypothetical protein
VANGHEYPTLLNVVNMSDEIGYSFTGTADVLLTTRNAAASGLPQVCCMKILFIYTM